MRTVRCALAAEECKLKPGQEASDEEIHRARAFALHHVPDGRDLSGDNAREVCSECSRECGWGDAIRRRPKLITAFWKQAELW